MSTTKSKNAEEDVTLDEFESHRQNLRDKKGIVTDITAVSKDKIRINVELSHGNTAFSKIMETEDLNDFMSNNSIGECRSSEAVVGEEVDVEYQNKEWQLDFLCSPNKDKSVDHSFRVSMAKFANVSSFLVMLISTVLIFVIPSTVYLTFVAFVFLTHITTSLYYQSTVGVASESDSVNPNRRAPITRRAYETYQKDSLPRRILDSLTLYLAT